MYVELMALYEGPSEDHHSAAGSQVNVIYAPCFDCTDPNDHHRSRTSG